MTLRQVSNIPQLLGNILRPQLRISPQHGPGLVPGDRGDFGDAQAHLKEPTGRLMAQIMQA